MLACANFQVTSVLNAHGTPLLTLSQLRLGIKLNPCQDGLRSTNSIQGHTIASLEASTTRTIVVNNRTSLPCNSQILPLNSSAALAGRPQPWEGCENLQAPVLDFSAEFFCTIQDGLCFIWVGGAITKNTCYPVSYFKSKRGSSRTCYPSACTRPKRHVH